MGTCMMLHLLRPERLPRPRRVGVAVSLFAGVAVGATLAWAAVHIRLESSVPAASEVLTSAPDLFELRFSGPVNEALSSLVLVDPAGDSVNVRCPDKRMPHAPQFVPPQVVHQHDNNIRVLRDIGRAERTVGN